MRSLAAALLTLYLLRLPLVTGLDFEDTGASVGSDIKYGGSVSSSSGGGEDGLEMGGRNSFQQSPPFLKQQHQLHAFLEHLAHASCRQHGREVAQYLADLAREIAARASAAPCEHKRNSELINSLLGLPKVMNDAGRK